MSTQVSKEKIQSALQAFGSGSLGDSARNLLNTFGYASERRIDLSPNNADTFIAELDRQKILNVERAFLDHWRSVDILFQLTSEEITLAAQGRFTFSGGRVDNTIIESYLFLAIHLVGGYYTRSQLAGITREVNKLFPMPVMLLFRHGDRLTLAIINRRLSKRDETRDVLEKVTLVKDISFADPLRAHIDILYDLSLPALHADFNFHNFVGLHKAWEKRLDTYQLNERFYRDIANWYFWALQHSGAVLPRDVKSEEQRSLFVIRLITRLIFCWFLQEKGLIPRNLFRRYAVEKTLKDFSKDSGTYYRAVLQNVFFATLNQEIQKRGFRSYNQSGGRHGNRGVTTLYRYRDAFRDPDAFIEMLKQVPFINGGLFDCLDQVFRNAENNPNVRLDDFSEEKSNPLCLPNELFFGDEREVDLSDTYQDKRKKKEKVRGIIEILSRYKFTVEENTPLEQEIALDPELLGKVFENLLASYNEDTRTTARKATGSFYTPREIVNYIVDEALIAYLANQLSTNGKQPQLETKLHEVFSALAGEFQNPFSQKETDALIAAIDGIKILDPACGSGAFPMGALHRMVDLLTKFDPNNRLWKEQQLARARLDRKLAEQMQDEVNRENALRDVDTRIADIERSFNTQFHELDFARKLYLIENCIYGVDIQPIACQIAKLRFFIALIVDQKVDPNAPNFGVRPLPNLETKIVAADTLMPIEKQGQHQFDLFDVQIKRLREGLELVRHEHFNARSPEKKARCRERDIELRKQIAEVLQKSGLPAPTVSALAAWDPYDQNGAAAFFDPAWMFSIKDGFDVVIGNPPYVRQEKIKELKPRLKEHYDCYTGTADLYVYFYERSIQLLRDGGVLGFISSNSFLNSAFAEDLRKYLLRQTALSQIVDFGETKVFSSMTEPSIVLLKKESLNGHKVMLLRWSESEPLTVLRSRFASEAFALSQNSLGKDVWILEQPRVLGVLDRIRTIGTPLGEYVKGRFYYGIKTGLNEAFVIDRETRDRLITEHPSSAEIIKPFLRGRDVKRWRVEQPTEWLIFARRGIDIKKYPAIRDYLLPFKKRLIPGAPGGRKPGSYEWYEIQDNIAYWQEFEQPKIVYQDIARYYAMAWDDSGSLLINTCYFIPRAEKWILGVLLSRVLFFYVQKYLGSDEGGFIRLFSIHVEKFPLPRADQNQKALIERIVDSCLWLVGAPKQSPKVNNNPHDSLLLGYFEQLLNGLVYELFFPDELHARKLFLFRYTEEAGLPVLAEIPEAKRLAALRETFECIYDLNHPIRGCLFSLRSLEPVRIIEGEA
jgi:type I restriction-modification system DNA methylase subunit